MIRKKYESYIFYTHIANLIIRLGKQYLDANRNINDKYNMEANGNNMKMKQNDKR